MCTSFTPCSNRRGKGQLSARPSTIAVLDQTNTNARFFKKGTSSEELLDFSFCLQHTCLFLFLAFYFCFIFPFFNLFLFFFLFFLFLLFISRSLACLPASFLLGQTWHFAGSTAHPKLYSSPFSSPLNLKNDRNRRENIPNITTTSHGTSRFVSERRFGMGCPSHLQVCYRFKKPTVFIV